MSIIAAGTPVKVNQGFNVYALGIVKNYSPDANKLGNKSNYTVEITGGSNCFGKPANIGELRTVLATHISVEV